MENMKDIIRKYFEGKDEVAAVYLYGSHLVGKNVPGSDVDIAVFIAEPLKKGMNSFKARTLMERDLSRLLRQDVDIVFLHEIGEVLLLEVLKKGEVVYEKDAISHHTFKASRLARCLDFRFYQERMQKGMVQAIRRETIGQYNRRS